MKRILLILVLPLFIAATSILVSEHLHESTNYYLNPVVKNAGIYQTGKHADQLSEQEKIKAHLSYAHQLLTHNSNSIQDEEVLQKRKAGLHALANYIEAGVFPKNVAYEGRRPCFVDDENNLCAVAHLLKVNGEDDLITSINRTFQYDYIKDIHHADFLAWVENCGFTLDELAIIQPTYSHLHKPRFNHQVSAKSIQRENANSYFSLGYNRVKIQEYNSKYIKQWQRRIGVNYEDYYNSNYAISANYDRTFFSFKALRVPVLFQYGFRPRYFNLDSEDGLNLEPYAMSIIPIRIKRKFLASINASYGYDIPVVGYNNFFLSRKMLSLGISFAYLRW